MSRLLRATVGYSPSGTLIQRTLSDAHLWSDTASGLLVPEGLPTNGIEVGAHNTGYRGDLSGGVISAGYGNTLNQAFLDTYNGGSNLIQNKIIQSTQFSSIQTQVTWRDCLFDNSSIELNHGNAQGMVFDHCSMYGNTTPGNYSWSFYAFMNASNFRASFCDVSGFGVAFHLGSDVEIEYTYLHDPAPYQSVENGGPPPDGTHHGLITLQFGQCQDVFLHHNHWKGYRGIFPNHDCAGMSACLTMYNDSYHPGPIVIEDNYFAGGGLFATYWGAVSGKPAPFADNVISRRNIFGREVGRFCGGTGIGTCTTSGGPVTAWSWTTGRVWEDNTWGPESNCGQPDILEGSAVNV